MSSCHSPDGTVEVSTAAPFVGALFCHRKRCQRRSGTTRSMTALCPPVAFSVSAGEDKMRIWDPGDGWLKAFCVDCGSHTHTISRDDPTLVAIRPRPEIDSRDRFGAWMSDQRAIRRSGAMELVRCASGTG